MKIILWCLVGLISISGFALDETGIGQEYITPLSYPKFSLSGDHSMSRHYHGFADPSLRYKIDNRFGAGVSFETGLYKYFNAGALTTFSFSNIGKKNEPIDIRFGIFAKPLIPLAERLSIFARTAVGATLPFPSMSPITPIDYLGKVSSEFRDSYKTVFKGQAYEGGAYGGFGSATIGLEFFPLSRLGIAVEWGIRADILTMGRKSPYVTRAPKDQEGAPPSFNYMMYEMPLIASLHIIL